MTGVKTIPAERDPTWMTRAACVGHDPELWYGLTEDTTVAAIAICHTCPVTTACLAAADGWGIWGGLTSHDRRRRRRGPAGHGLTWTADDDQRLCQLHEQGMTDEAIGEQLHRSRASIKERRRVLELRRPRGTTHSETVIDAVRRYAAAGLTDRRIAVKLNLTDNQIEYIRRSSSIPAGNTSRQGAYV